MVQFGASELAKIATFPGRCPVGTSLGIEEGELGVAGTEIVTDVKLRLSRKSERETACRIREGPVGSREDGANGGHVQQHPSL